MLYELRTYALVPGGTREYLETYHAIGQDVRVTGAVTGSASLAGYDVTVEASVGGNLRALGARVDAVTLVYLLTLGGVAVLGEGDRLQAAAQLVDDVEAGDRDVALLSGR